MTGRLPSTLLGALRSEVEIREHRLSYYAGRSTLQPWERKHRKEYALALAAARRELEAFEAGIPPRVMPGADSHELLKSPAGLPLCRWCETECASKRRTFCGEACVHEWKLRSNAGYARRKVWERDAGQCALCPAVVGMHGAWEMDHVVPVAEGGGCCSLDGLRTLCRPCHRRVTAELAGRLAERRRAS